MQGGDLSNAPSPRALITFEGLIAMPPTGKAAIKAKALASLNRWDAVVGYWDLDPVVQQQMFDMAWRLGTKFDIVTFREGPEFATAIFKLLDARGVAMSYVHWFPDVASLAHNLAYWPDVRIIYTPDRNHSMAYGGRGKLVVDRVRDFTS